MSNRPRRIFAAIVLAASLTGVGIVAGTAAMGNAPGPTASVPTTPGDSVPPLPSGPINPSPYPPSVPDDLTVTAVHAGSVTLSWTASHGGCCGVDHYLVTYGQAFNDVFMASNVGNVTTATITSGIQPGSQYFFRVSALDDLNHQSAGSNQVVVVTPVSDTAADTTPPAAPGTLTLDGTTLRWAASSDNVAVVAYDVYRFDGWFASQLVGSTAGTSLAAPAVGGGVQFYVRARDAAGNVSIASNTVTTSAPPTTPPVTPACRAGYRTTSNWAGGFVAEVTLTNSGPSTIDGWALAFTFGGDQRVGSAWNAAATQSGPTVTLRNVGWNRTLAPGATATIGMIGSWKLSDAAPAAFTLNGLPCASS